MIHIERRIKGETVVIGWIENMDRCEWDWTCFDAFSNEEYEPYSQGCATTRKDAESEVRREYRNQIINKPI